MNLQIQNAGYMNYNHALAPINAEVLESKPLRKPFIEANTEDVDLLHLQTDLN